MTESDLQQLIQMIGVEHGCILMRNNSGAFKDVTGRWVRYGLGNISKKHNDKIKSSDLIGIREIVITPDMVGKRVGVFTAIEVKDPAWTLKPKDTRAQAQEAFIEWVKGKGGIAGFATSIEDFKKVLSEL